MGNDVISNCKNPCDGSDHIARDKFRQMKTKKVLQNKNKQEIANQKVEDIIADYLEEVPSFTKPIVLFQSGASY